MFILASPCVGGGTGVLGAMLVMFSYRFTLCNGSVFPLNGNVFPVMVMELESCETAALLFSCWLLHGGNIA